MLEEARLVDMKKSKERFPTNNKIYCPLFKCRRTMSGCFQCNVNEAVYYIPSIEKYVCGVEVNGKGSSDFNF